MIAPTTTTKHIEVWELSSQFAILEPKFYRITIFQFYTFPELGMTLAGCIRSNASNSPGPVFVLKYIFKMCRVCTIDHVIGRSMIGCLIDGINSVFERTSIQ